MEEAAAQEGVGQFLLIVRGDDDDRPLSRADRLARFIDVELHTVEFLQQVVREFDVGLVDLVDQQDRRFFGRERLPQLAALDVVGDVVNPLVAELRIPQPRDRIIFVEPLGRFGCRFDVPLDQRRPHRLRDLGRKDGLAGSGFAFDEERAAQCGGGVYRNLQIFRSDVVFGAVEAHSLFPFLRSQLAAHARGGARRRAT